MRAFYLSHLCRSYSSLFYSLKLNSNVRNKPDSIHFLTYFSAVRYEAFIEGSAVCCGSEGAEPQTLLGLAQCSLQQVRQHY